MAFPGPDALTGGFLKRLDSNSEQLVSRNWDEVLSRLEQCGPIHFEMRNRALQSRAKLELKNLKDIALCYTWFSPAMEIRSTPDSPYYKLIFCNRGTSEYIFHKQTIVSSPSRGVFLPGMQPMRVRTAPNWEVFGAKFSPDALKGELSRLLDREIIRPVEFSPSVNFEKGAGLIIRSILGQLFVQAGNPNTGQADFAIRQMERSLITLVLEGLGHNYTKLVNGIERGIAPWQLRAVEEFIHQSADQPLTLGDLAGAGGISARSLQNMFLRRRGISPMEFLRRVRFERVREELLHPNHDTTVTSAAVRWGFLHPSRFAAEYQSRFGEKPSETLRRSSKSNG